MSSALEVSRVRYEYPDKRVLEDVSFSVEAGTVTALVGPNGAGKTTLLRLIAALDAPYSGRILVDGIDTQEAPRECHAKIGYLSDSFGLYNELTVHQCLLHAARMHGLRDERCRERVLETASLVGATPLLKQSAGSLSRGQRQRVGIAQTLIHQPRIVILDEPASGLDPEARVELSALIRSMRERGLTLLISSHILAELQDYSDSMLTLREGRIIGHVPISGRGNTSAPRTLALRIHGDQNRAIELLRNHSRVREVQVLSAEIRVTLSDGSDQGQVGLLKELLSHDIQVLSFTESVSNMESVYLSQTSTIGDKKV